MAKKKHGFHSTTIKHHDDGSHTMHHHHKNTTPTENHDVEHAVGDDAGMMGSMQSNLGEPAGGEGEEALEAGAAGGGGGAV